MLAVSSPSTSDARPRVVVVGGGFAGLSACRSLASAPVAVTLIDRRNFNLFQPLLYQVATGQISSDDISSPLRQLVGTQSNLDVIMADVCSLDPDQRLITLANQTLAYDYLVLACGSEPHYFGQDHWRRSAPPMKVIEDAQEIRSRLLSALERAEVCDDPDLKRQLLSVVIIGAGPTGCELAGAVQNLMDRMINSNFKHLELSQCTITVVDALDRVLPSMDAALSSAAAHYLASVGIQLRLNARVSDIRENEVVIEDQTGSFTLQAATICWTAGVRANQLTHQLAEATGCSLDRSGRVQVDHNFAIPAYPEIRVIGDACCYVHTNSGMPLPGMAGPAVQMGAWVAKSISACIAQTSCQPFQYRDLGSMAVLGPAFAVADLRGLKVTGVPGWILWASAHLAFLPQIENRLSLFVKWMWKIISKDSSSLVIIPSSPTEP